VTGDRGDDPYVRRWGSQDGRALLFLHALGPASSAAFVGLGVQSLVEAGYAVAAPDLPGYGRSAPVQPEEYAVPALAARMADLADDLGWARYVLVGHSWGGAIACHLAAEHPDRVRALVLVDSGHLDYADTPGADLASSLGDLMARGEERRLHLADRAAVAELLDVPEEDPLVDAFLEGMEGDPDGGLVSRTRGSASGPALYHLARSRQSETWPVIARHRIPTLLLLATSPEEARMVNVAGAADLSAAVPQTEVRWVTGATHSLVTDERERFGATVAGWLADLD
jgi:pimeloyl-ACP methyl ester carboxylesterase